jgi:hypothetical protein
MSEEERDVLLLASAKENLRKLAFFGICELQRDSQYLFETTFKLRFLRPFIQLNETHSSIALSELEPEMLEKIRKLNHLDIELYEYGKNLLYERFQTAKASDKNFEENYKRLSAIPENDEDAPEARLLRKFRTKSQKLSSTSTTTASDMEEAYVDELISSMDNDTDI